MNPLGNAQIGGEGGENLGRPESTLVPDEQITAQTGIHGNNQ
jgi:hypothetical protein